MPVWIDDPEKAIHELNLGKSVGLFKDGVVKKRMAPRYQKGDLLWVREAWHTDSIAVDKGRAEHEDIMSASPICYRADKVHEGSGCSWRSPMFMPKWAARIWLKVLSVRVERLQDITIGDIEKEGISANKASMSMRVYGEALKDKFAVAWDAINKKRGYSWESNPWVYVIKFEEAEG